MFCHISLKDSSYTLMDVVEKHTKPLDKCTIPDICKGVRVFVNGKWIGIGVDDGNSPTKLVNILRTMKRRLDINYQTGICYKRLEKSIHINTDSGRMMKPLLIVENGKVKLSKVPFFGVYVKLNKERVAILRKLKTPRYKDSIMNLFEEGLLELVDVEEEDNLMIAMYTQEVSFARA